MCHPKCKEEIQETIKRVNRNLLIKISRLPRLNWWGGLLYSWTFLGWSPVLMTSSTLTFYIFHETLPRTRRLSNTFYAFDWRINTYGRWLQTIWIEAFCICSCKSKVSCEGLWCLDEYWYYNVFTLLTLVLFESMMMKCRIMILIVLWMVACG